MIDNDTDDGPEVVYVGGKPDKADRKWWERDREYLDDLWAGEGFTFGSQKYSGNIPQAETKQLARRAEALIVAHGMVKSFVQTFATGAGVYDVVFDPNLRTAGTDYGARKIRISPAPALDPTIDAKTAGLILTAMAVHEASHVRHGRKYGAAVAKEFPKSVLAQKASNWLADATIDRLFVNEYPGYRGVFAPALKYVYDSGVKSGIDPFDTPENVAVCATRYDDQAPWDTRPELAGERAWWRGWLNQFARNPETKVHVDGVREALKHLDELRQQQPEQPQQGQGDGGDGQGQQAQGQGGQSEGSPQQGAAGGASPGGQAPQGGKAPPAPPRTLEEILKDVVRQQMEAEARQRAEQEAHDQETQAEDRAQAADVFGGCLTTGVERASIQNGVKPDQIDNELAEAIIKEAAFATKTSTGWVVEARPAKSIGNSREGVGPLASGSAASAIRAALLASRSGHHGVVKSQKRGRCDNSSIHRIAMNDQRLFHRRTAASPGRYLVWLLVDRSGSMNGAPTAHTIATSKALAEAFRYVSSMRLEIYGWTDAQRGTTNYGANAGAYRVWGTGEPVDNVDDLLCIAPGGTPDQPVLEWAGEAIRKATQSGEQPIILMASDGHGYLESKHVNAIRAKGVRVVSVAIGNQVTPEHQQSIYGDDYIAWQGSIEKTARPIARMLGKLVAS